MRAIRRVAEIVATLAMLAAAATVIRPVAAAATVASTIPAPVTACAVPSGTAASQDACDFNDGV